MKLPIYVYGAEVLREKAENIDLETADKEELRKLAEDMFETMYFADGVGLAAPQIGKSIRFLVVDGSALADEMPELKDFKRVMINPEVLEQSEETAEYGEGCLSVPNVHADIVRPASMKVRYIDTDFEERTEDLTGFACRMVQHEMDHLDGVLFVDRAAPIRKKMLHSKLTNILRRKVRTHYNIK